MPQKLLTYLFLFLGMFTYSQVVINEIDADNPGNDVYEFVELKSSTPNFPLDGYVLVFFNDSNSSSYYTFDLDGFVTDINGIIHFGNVAVTPAPVGIIPNNNDKIILSRVIEAKLPIVQNSIDASSPNGSAIYLSIIIPASAKDEIIIPAKI